MYETMKGFMKKNVNNVIFLDLVSEIQAELLLRAGVEGSEDDYYRVFDEIYVYLINKYRSFSEDDLVVSNWKIKYLNDLKLGFNKRDEVLGNKWRFCEFLGYDFNSKIIEKEKVVTSDKKIVIDRVTNIMLNLVKYQDTVISNYVFDRLESEVFSLINNYDFSLVKVNNKLDNIINDVVVRYGINLSKVRDFKNQELNRNELKDFLAEKRYWFMLEVDRVLKKFSDSDNDNLLDLGNLKKIYMEAKENFDSYFVDGVKDSEWKLMFDDGTELLKDLDSELQRLVLVNKVLKLKNLLEKIKGYYFDRELQYLFNVVMECYYSITADVNMVKKLEKRINKVSSVVKELCKIDIDSDLSYEEQLRILYDEVSNKLEIIVEKFENVSVEYDELFKVNAYAYLDVDVLENLLLEYSWIFDKDVPVFVKGGTDFFGGIEFLDLFNHNKKIMQLAVEHFKTLNEMRSLKSTLYNKLDDGEAMLYNAYMSGKLDELGKFYENPKDYVNDISVKKRVISVEKAGFEKAGFAVGINGVGKFFQDLSENVDNICFLDDVSMELYKGVLIFSCVELLKDVKEIKNKFKITKIVERLKKSLNPELLNSSDKGIGGRR